MELKKELFPDEVQKKQRLMFFESSKEIIDAIEKEILKYNFPIKFTHCLMEVNYKLILKGDFFIEVLEEFVEEYNNNKASEYMYVIIEKTLLGLNHWSVCLDLRKRVK